MAQSKNAYESNADYGLAPGQPSPLVSYPDPPASRMITPSSGANDGPVRATDIAKSQDSPPDPECVAAVSARPLGSTASSPRASAGTQYGSPATSRTAGRSRARASTQRY